MHDNSGADFDGVPHNKSTNFFFLLSQSHGVPPNDYGAPKNSGLNLLHASQQSQFYKTPKIPSQVWTGQMNMVTNSHNLNALAAGVVNENFHGFNQGSSQLVRILLICETIHL
jgi:hypothetical protein